MFSDFSSSKGVVTGFVALSLGLACFDSARIAFAGEPGGLKFSRRCLMVSPNVPSPT